MRLGHKCDLRLKGLCEPYELRRYLLKNNVPVDDGKMNLFNSEFYRRLFRIGTYEFPCIGGSMAKVQCVASFYETGRRGKWNAFKKTGIS